MNLLTQAIEIGLNVVASLFQACSGEFRIDGITDQSGTSFFDDQSMFQDFGLSLVEFRAHTIQSLRPFVETCRKFRERAFLLAKASLATFDIAQDGVAFFFAAALLSLKIRERRISGTVNDSGFAVDGLFTFRQQSTHMLQLAESETVQFQELQAFAAEQLLFSSKFAEFRFKIIFGPSQVFELESIAALEIVLFGQQSLSFLFDFFTQSRLFGFDIAGVDYEADVDPVTPIANVVG